MHPRRFRISSCDDARRTRSTIELTSRSSSFPVPTKRIASPKWNSTLTGSGNANRYGVTGMYGAPKYLPELVQIQDRRHRFTAAEKRAGDHRRLGLQRQPQEPGAKPHQRVALAVELGRAAHALGKNHQQALVFEQARRVFRQTGEVTGFLRPLAGERHLRQKLLGHALRQARRIQIEKTRSRHHAGIEREASRMIAHDHRAPAFRHVLDAVDFAAMVVAIVEAQEAHEIAQVALGNSVGIDPGAVERQLQPLQPLVHLAIDAREHAVAAHLTFFSDVSGSLDANRRKSRESRSPSANGRCRPASGKRRAAQRHGYTRNAPRRLFSKDVLPRVLRTNCPRRVSCFRPSVWSKVGPRQSCGKTPTSGNARSRQLFEFLVGAAALTVSAATFGYSGESVVSDGCHERITMDALRRVRSELPGAGLVAPNADERALIDDMPCELDSDMRELGAVSMLLGNRDVDLLGNAPNDLSELAPIHGDPNRQDEHCLRSAGDDEPTGSETALQRCRDGIAARARASLNGLDGSGVPDPGRRQTIEVFLELRGSVDAALPTYHVEVGRALHTLQDSFSHVYRNPADQRLVTVVLNYVDFAEERLEEAIDGPPHNSSLDRCVDLDAFRAERLELATRASYELIRVSLEPNADPSSKLANIDEVLSRYLTFDPLSDCSLSNGWCNAPEKQYAEQRGCICSHVSSDTAAPHALTALGACAMLFYGRRRKRRCSKTRRSSGMALALFATTAIPAQARAADLAPPPVRKEEPSRLGVVGAASGALQNGAFAASVGGVFRLSPSVLVGLEAEYNPWFSVRTFDVKRGSTNVYAVGVLRFPLRYQRVNLRSTLQLGVSRMNFALFGVPEGSVGPYVGFNLLGVDYELTNRILLIVNPAHIAIPIPKTSSVPFAYLQYRVTVGVQFGG